MSAGYRATYPVLDRGVSLGSAGGRGKGHDSNRGRSLECTPEADRDLNHGRRLSAHRWPGRGPRSRTWAKPR